MKIRISKVTHSSEQWTKFGVGIKFVLGKIDLLSGKYAETHVIQSLS